MSRTSSLPRAVLTVSFVSLLMLLGLAVRTSESASNNKLRATTPLSGAPMLVQQYHSISSAAALGERSRSTQAGIIEDVPQRYLARYQQWKREFLATDTGRQQWDFYQNNPNFTLTIVVSRDNAEGGTTSNYKWSDDGKLIAATITLGCRLDDGFPNPVYFPVMNSLVPSESERRIAGQTLAATKLAHEFGHVNRTANGDANLYQLQSQLIPQYNEIFLNNGRDANDPRLIELTRKMGGTPVEIWEDREYWGETNAMAYLRDRISEDGLRCQLFSKIKRSVDLYAPGYEQRFLNIAQSTPAGRHCGW